MTDSRVYVVALQLGISPSAGLAGRPPWAVKGRLPLRFDFDKPAVWVSGRNDEPTIFANRQEAEAKVTDFVARVRGIIRASQRTGKSADVGIASMLLGWDAGDGKLLGGYEVVLRGA